MIFSRKKPEKSDAVSRYETYKKKNIVHHHTAVDAVRHGFRFIKQGVSCGIIVPNMHGVSTVMAAIVAGGFIEKLKVIKERDDGFIFDNDIQIRVIPRTNESIAPILLGRDEGKSFKIIQAKEGDPQMQKFNDLMGFD